MGLPCLGESEAGDRELLRAFTDAFPEIPLYLTNDVEVGWAGSLGLASGINVVSGTGSIAFGKDESGQAARCGGWSEFFSDEGSCYYIGRKSLQLFSKQADGRVPKDELYSIFRKEFDIKNDFEIIDLVHNEYLSNRDKVAALQLLAKEAALAGSCSARSLYIDAADELCDMVKAIKKQLHFINQPFPVSYSGGLFKAGELILTYFNEYVTAIGGNPVTPKYEPVYGAVLLAFEQNCSENLPGLRKRLDEL
jgi:N-acetylglucosamine kinase-like BadF-type ATPase